MSNHLTMSSSTLTTLRHLEGAVRRFGRLPSVLLPTAFEPISLAVPAIGIRDGCIAIEGAGLEPMTIWIFRERREHLRAGFPIGREVRHVFGVACAGDNWWLSSVDGAGVPDELDLELAAAVVDTLADFLSSCEDLLCGLGRSRVERTFLIPALPRIGLLHLGFGSSAARVRLGTGERRGGATGRLRMHAALDRGGPR
jgi:hypothetical protein